MPADRDPEALPQAKVAIVPDQLRCSIVIPAFNSAAVLGELIDRAVDFCRSRQLEHELIVVDDGSIDSTWSVLGGRTTRYPQLVAIRLAENRGQHNAILCGLRHCRGDFAITIDDDLQNPPEGLGPLIDGARQGSDVVFGRFAARHASRPRRLGSFAIQCLVRLSFGKPAGLVVSNVRLLRRDVIDRICRERTPFPYISGLALRHARQPSNAWLPHARSRLPASRYDARRLVALALRIALAGLPHPVPWLASLAGGEPYAIREIVDHRERRTAA